MMDDFLESYFFFFIYILIRTLTVTDIWVWRRLTWWARWGSRSGGSGCSATCCRGGARCASPLTAWCGAGRCRQCTASGGCRRCTLPPLQSSARVGSAGWCGWAASLWTELSREGQLDSTSRQANVIPRSAVGSYHSQSRSGGSLCPPPGSPALQVRTTSGQGHRSSYRGHAVYIYQLCAC